jgi:hypothetical protein
MTYRAVVVVVVLIVVAGGCSSVSQLPDLEFEPAVGESAYPEGEGPVVLIDGGHHNFHTADGGYAAFAKLLRRDGYVVRGSNESSTPESLARGDIFVIANALAESDVKKWRLPTSPAFTGDEVEAIHDWVKGGGSLFLIADHMPMPGAVEDLAAAFGLLFGNGYVFLESGTSRITFSREDGSLADHPITRGRSATEKVDSVHAFTGQGFRSERPIEPLMTLPSGSTLRLPVNAGEFKDTTAEVPAAGMYQGAVFRYGEGRVAVFGEAAMFSAQKLTIDDRVLPMGMNAPEAAQNPQFLLNIMHWLSGLIGN